MTNFTITINAPELVGAINNLASAFGNKNALAGVEVEQPKAKSTPTKIEDMKPPTPSTQKTKAKEEPPVEPPFAPIEEPPAEEPEVETESNITLEHVRKKLAAHSSLGKEQQLEVKDALSRFGVKKLTDIEPKDYPELLDLVGVAE